MKRNWCSVVFLLPLSGVLLAADTGIEGAITQSLSYDDNFLFREAAQDTWIYTLTPQLTGYYRTPTYTSTLNGAVEISRHSSFGRYDRNNPRLNWQQSWLRPRSAYNLGVGYQRADQRSEAVDDLGDFTTRSRVTTYSITPSYMYQWSEQDTLTLAFSYSERNYSGDTTTSNDNQNYTLNTGWSHQMDERLALRGNLSYTRYEAEGRLTETQSDIWRITGGATYEWSERTTATLLVGASWQETRERIPLLSVEDKSTNTGSVITLQWNHQSLIDSYSATFSRDLFPSSDGAVREQDRLTLGWGRPLSDVSRVSLNTSWLKSTDDDRTREYFSLAPSYTHELSPDLSVTGRYDYKWQKRSDEGSVEGNVLRVNLVYQF